MAGIIVLTVMMLWQCVLVGYSISLASRAADRSAREAAVHVPDAPAASRGEDAGRAGLPAAWRDGSDIAVRVEGDRVQSDVRLEVPLVIPGWANIPMTVTASSAASV